MFEVAREAPEGCAAGATPVVAPSLAEGLAAVEAATELLAAFDPATEHDVTLAEAAVEAQRLRDRLAAQHLRVLAAAEGRGVHQADGAVSMSGWFAARTRLDAHEVATALEAARRLEELPRLAEAFAAGEVSYSHVATITRAAVPPRMAAIRAVEEPLVDLARRAAPLQVRRALRRVRDIVDPDGTDEKPMDDGGPDERRELRANPTIDDLWSLRGSLDTLTGELLASLLDAYMRPDPPDTPVEHQRSAAQRRHDAFAAMLRDLAGSGQAPTRHGAAPHVLLMVDLLALAGLVDQATRPEPTLRFTGRTTIAVARALFAQALKTTVVLTMGPWRVVALGNTTRTLPAWLRPVLQMVHQRCRGPDCDRPATWGDAHHVRDWDTHRDTDLNDTIPLCRAHHGWVTRGRWTVDYDPDTGICAWTGPGGRRRTTHPPQP